MRHELALALARAAASSTDEERAAYRRAAVAALRSSLEDFQNMEVAGTLSPGDAGVPEELARELAALNTE